MKNNTMNRSIANLLVTGLGLLLLIYSATRSLDFISMTLPADKQVLAWFGLAALDGGLIFWLLHFLFSARGGMQRGIALLMVIVDFVGCVAMFTMDTLYRTGESGLTAILNAGEIRAAVLGLSLIIALNVGAVIFNHIADPDNRKRMAAEAAKDEIEETAIQQIAEHAPQLASELAPKLASDWIAKTRAQYMGLIGEGGNVIDGKLSEPQPAPARRHTPGLGGLMRRRNGSKAYSAESEQAAPDFLPTEKGGK